MKISRFMKFAVLGISVILGAWLAVGILKARADQTEKAPSGSDHPDFLALKARDGLLLVSNAENSPFTLRIRGKSVRTGTVGEGDDQFGVVVTDGLILQFVTAYISDFYNGDASKLDDHEILKKHEEWETAYLGKKIGSPLKLNLNISIKGPNGRIFQYWEYDMPHPPKDGIKRNLMLVTRVKNVLVVLNGLLVDVKDADALAKKLMETGYSVAASTTPITVDQAKSMAINN